MQIWLLSVGGRRGQQLKESNKQTGVHTWHQSYVHWGKHGRKCRNGWGSNDETTTSITVEGMGNPVWEMGIWREKHVCIDIGSGI